MSEKVNKAIFLWTGQGAQFPNMGDDLQQSNTVFAAYWHDYLDRYQKISGHDLRLHMRDETIHQTQYTQPALVIFELAMAQVMHHHGLSPICHVGHSIGELAACIHDGVMTVDDGLWLVHHRARLMQSCPTGTGMLACLISSEKLQEYLTGTPTSIAGINAPKQTVVSGPITALEQLKIQLGRVRSILLPVSHGFHSPAMEPIADTFYDFATQIDYSPAKTPIYANATAEMQTTFDANYWVTQLLSPVQFMGCIQQATETFEEPIVELGPKATLSQLTRLCNANTCLLDPVEI